MASPDAAAAAGPVANIKVMSPAPQITTPLDFALPLGSTVRQLKERIMETVEGSPDVAQQRLIYRGKFLRDEQSIGGILGASANGEDPETSGSYTFHLALRPSGLSPLSAPRGLSSLLPDRPLDLNSNMTIPTPTPTSTTITPSPTISQPASHPATTILGSDRVAVLERQRQSIQEAIGNVRQRLDRINDLTTLASSTSRTSSAPAVVTRVATRVDYGPTRETGGRLTRTTHTRTTTASVRLSTRNGGVRSVPTSPVGTGGSAGSSSSLGSAGVGDTQGQVTGNISTFNIPDLNNIIAGLQSGTAVGTTTTPPLYLLQGPEGQCLLLAGPPSSTPSTSLPPSPPQQIITRIASEDHPVIQQVGIDGYLPGESPTDTFSSEASLPGISPESLAQLLDPTSYRLGGPGTVSGIRRAAASREANSTALAIQELLVRERAHLREMENWVAQHEQRRRNRHHPHQQQPQQRQMRQVNMNIGDLVRRVQDGGAHVWLAVRLVVFVALFSGGAGWRRRIVLGVFAAVVFVWQTGVLEGRINAARALYRELFPAPVQVPVQQQQPQQPQQPQQQQQQAGGRDMAQTQANQQLNPAVTAQLLVQRDNLRRQTRVREVYEIVERVVRLFVASLVPGMGERQVRAHEERERLRGGGGGAAAAEEEERMRREREGEDAQRGVEDAVGGLFVAGL